MDPQSAPPVPVPPPVPTPPVAPDSQPIIQDVTDSTNAYILSHTGLMWTYGLILLASIAVIIYIGAFQLLALPFIVAVAGYAHIEQRFKKEFTMQFGASIGFSYSPSADMSTVNGRLFKIGHSQRIYDVLSGIHDNLPMRIFTLGFTVGYGKESHSYEYTVFDVSLAREVPSILLLSKIHQTGATDFFSGDESISLEGDFNKYFSLRVPKGYEMEAYQIFTPDVMAYLIDYSTKYSFEFSGNRLYIVGTEVMMNRDQFTKAFTLVGYLDNLFRHNAQGIDMPTQAMLS